MGSRPAPTQGNWWKRFWRPNAIRRWAIGRAWGSCGWRKSIPPNGWKRPPGVACGLVRGMADAFTQQQEEPQTAQLSFEERFALLVDRQWNWRQNRALERRLREGRLQGPACMEDIDFRAARGLDKQVVRSLMNDSD